MALQPLEQHCAYLHARVEQLEADNHALQENLLNVNAAWQAEAVRHMQAWENKLLGEVSAFFADLLGRVLGYPNAAGLQKSLPWDRQAAIVRQQVEGILEANVQRQRCVMELEAKAKEVEAELLEHKSLVSSIALKKRSAGEDAKGKEEQMERLKEEQKGDPNAQKLQPLNEQAQVVMQQAEHILEADAQGQQRVTELQAQAKMLEEELAKSKEQALKLEAQVDTLTAELSRMKMLDAEEGRKVEERKRKALAMFVEWKTDSVLPSKLVRKDNGEFQLPQLVSVEDVVSIRVLADLAGPCWLEGFIEGRKCKLLESLSGLQLSLEEDVALVKTGDEHLEDFVKKWRNDLCRVVLGILKAEVGLLRSVVGGSSLKTQVECSPLYETALAPFLPGLHLLTDIASSSSSSVPTVIQLLKRMAQTVIQVGLTPQTPGAEHFLLSLSGALHTTLNELEQVACTAQVHVPEDASAPSLVDDVLKAMDLIPECAAFLPLQQRKDAAKVATSILASLRVNLEAAAAKLEEPRKSAFLSNTLHSLATQLQHSRVMSVLPAATVPSILEKLKGHREEYLRPWDEVFHNFIRAQHERLRASEGQRVTYASLPGKGTKLPGYATLVSQFSSDLLDLSKKYSAVKLSAQQRTHADSKAHELMAAYNSLLAQMKEADPKELPSASHVEEMVQCLID